MNAFTRRPRRTLFFCLGLLLLTGCDMITGSDAAGLRFEPPSAELTIGDTLWAEVQVYDRGGRRASAAGVEWRPLWGVWIDWSRRWTHGRARLVATRPGTYHVVVEAGTRVDSMRVTVHGHRELRLTALAMSRFACGLAEDGATYCWGNGQYVGPNPTIPGGFSMYGFAAPRRVRGGVPFVSLVTALQAACGLAGDGLAYCWGHAGHGSLGQPGLYTAAEPLPVAGGHRFTRLAGQESHVCGLALAGEAYCWGSNLYGQLGIPKHAESCSDNLHPPCSDVPARVAAEVPFTAIITGSLHTCGLTAEGAAYCWGLDNRYQLGSTLDPDHCEDMFGLYHCSRTPIRVEGAPPFVQLALGGHHSCGVTAGGRVYCWGSNDVGQLGTGVPGDTPVPQPVDSPVLFASLWSGYQTTCGITAEGAAYCWGQNRQGQAGSAPSTRCQPTGIHCVPRPEPAAGNLRFRQLAMSYYTTCGLAEDGVYCWGGSFGLMLESGEPWPAESTTPLRVYGTR
jgi:hypothetical protein